MSATSHLMLTFSHSRWMSWLADSFGRNRPPAGKQFLRVGDLSPHLQRDLGFLDGNDPCGRRC